jgi:hypothetical protein
VIPSLYLLGLVTFSELAYDRLYPAALSGQRARLSGLLPI